MARLVIVSNRVLLPQDRQLRAGGLAVALRDTLRREGGVWFGWSGKLADETPSAPQILVDGNITYATLDLGRVDHELYYTDYANTTLWPLLHYRPGLFEFKREAFDGYMRVNAAFAAALVPLLRGDDLIWVHDYHFIPLAAKLRKLELDNRIGLFLHTPFPAAEVLISLPRHPALMSALTHYDLIGFQTENDRRALFDYVVNEARGRVAADGTIEAFGRRAHAAVFPIGIDTEAFARMAQTAARASESRRLRDSIASRDLIIGVDRLDYSKGLSHRFLALRELLTAHPEYKQRVTFLQIAPISRGEVPQYKTLRRDLERLAGNINGQFANFDWTPVRYVNRGFSRQTLAGFYRMSRVGLVTPLRDGMNLVAKEYVAAQDPEDPGVLVLSRFAGAARELTDALIVNPHDNDEMAEALHRALTMPLAERRARWEAMMALLRRNTIAAWRDNFLDALQHGPAAPPAMKAQLVSLMM